MRARAQWMLKDFWVLRILLEPHDRINSRTFLAPCSLPTPTLLRCADAGRLLSVARLVTQALQHLRPWRDKASGLGFENSQTFGQTQGSRKKQSPGRCYFSRLAGPA